MTSVRAFTAYPMCAPGPRVRLQGFTSRLAGNGIELGIHSSLTEDEYRTISSSSPSLRKARAVLGASVREVRRGVDSDLTLVHRLLSITPIPGVDPPRHLDAYDFDDALHLGSRGENNPFAAVLKREEARWHAYVRRARLVIAGNEYLADAATGAGAKQVEVIPSCVEPGEYRTKVHGDSGTLTVGWIGSASTTPYLDVVVSAMEKVIARGIEARLVLVGAGPTSAPGWVERRTWSLDSQAEDLASFDIGVMPMPDEPWTRGKCGYKILQYFAAGLPVIASPVGVAAAMASSERGRTAEGSEEWASAITELGADRDLRSQMGSAGREFVESHYSYERWAPELAALLGNLA